MISDPDMVPEAFKQQAAVFDEIGAETINCIPDNWRSAVLLIKCDGRRIDYSLKNDQSQDGTAVISQRLAQLAEQLYTLMASQGHAWTEAELRYVNNGQKWKFTSSFTYKG